MAHLQQKQGTRHVEACLDRRSRRHCRHFLGVRSESDSGFSRHLEGRSESIVLGGGNPHHTPTPSSEPQFRSVPFTMTIDKQEGRRFSGTFSSSRSSEKIIAVYSRNGTILLADDEGYTYGTMLAPNRLELCYLHVSPAARIASCAEMTRQP